ncbi:winged helix-turn-helix transcriptional regulator [Pseudonocardia kunmingensis]|uniref:HxlR family transcriptional regulator n=1 Tax=Pseudonocardia kunmingensis TaxID=630975 RepID=A0A543E1N5_9PSEU|nr:helix-turn-helix domain-containing protein [Pseudonocardia kunmingensis]TQM15493.1 HxlR family transcriptional regulator [Pseudonocardia kunmingensis]
MPVGVEDTRHLPDPLSDAFNSDCPGRTVFVHLTNRWGILILTALRDGPLRFYLLRDRIGGISEKMLSQNLRAFVRDGLIEREVEPSVPPKVSYALTPLGVGAAEPLKALVAWIGTHTPEVLAAQERHDAATGRTTERSP